ncbi:MAG: hypothetical protein ACP5PQ_03920 [Thermoproteota archaeon]
MIDRFKIGGRVYTPDGQLFLEGDRIVLKSWEELSKAKSKRSVKNTLLEEITLFSLHLLAEVKSWNSKLEARQSDFS